MKSVYPYLNFPGNAEEAFNFYKSVFGGDFSYVMRFNQAPEPEKGPAGEGEKIMHISLPMGNSMLMASDVPEAYMATFKEGTNVYLMVAAESREEADRLFGRLCEGGQVEMPMADMFWGDYFGSCIDKFGIKWMIDYENPKQ